jgi:hypothetical protein
MERMKWQQDGVGIKSADGRFEVHSTCRNPKWFGYVGLTDTATGEEFPCRTIDSAKAAARNILRTGKRG